MIHTWHANYDGTTVPSRGQTPPRQAQRCSDNGPEALTAGSTAIRPPQIRPIVPVLLEGDPTTHFAAGSLRRDPQPQPSGRQVC